MRSIWKEILAELDRLAINVLGFKLMVCSKEENKSNTFCLQFFTLFYSLLFWCFLFFRKQLTVRTQIFFPEGFCVLSPWTLPLILPKKEARMINLVHERVPCSEFRRKKNTRNSWQFSRHGGYYDVTAAQHNWSFLSPSKLKTLMRNFTLLTSHFDWPTTLLMQPTLLIGIVIK